MLLGQGMCRNANNMCACVVMLGRDCALAFGRGGSKFRLDVTMIFESYEDPLSHMSSCRVTLSTQTTEVHTI